MPQVKKKTNRAAKKVGKKSTRKKASQSRRQRSFFQRLYDRFRDYTLAGTAGAIVIVAGLGVLFWFGGYFGLMVERVDRFVGQSVVAAGFDVRRVTLMGRGSTERAEIDDAVGPVMGQSILHLDLDATRARVEDLGWVRSAAVSRLWPNTIHVSIKERAPAAVWQLSGNLHLIDNNGAVIRDVNAYEYSSLPLIVGAGAPEAVAAILHALEKQPELEAMTSALVRVGKRRWNMRLHNKTDIKLPEAGFEDALEALSIMHAAQGTLDQNFEYIDLRDSERVIVRPRNDGSAGEQQ